MKVKLLSHDITDLLINLPYPAFLFPDYPGNITYSPINRLDIFLDGIQTFKVDNNFSKVFGLGKQPEVTIYDDFGAIVAKSYVQEAKSLETNKYSLTLIDSIDRILNKNQVIAVYNSVTPARLLINLCVAYGIQYDSSLISLSSRQILDGLIFDFEINLDQQQTFRSVIDQLCVAGFMRLAVYNGRIYGLDFFKDNISNPGLVILGSEILSIPSENDSTWPRYGGGEVKWGGPTIPSATVQVPQGQNFAEFNQDYSQVGFRLLNGDGALKLIRYATSETIIKKHYVMDIDWVVGTWMTLGQYIGFEKGTIGKNQVIGRLVGREVDPSKYGHVVKCTFEVSDV